MDDKKAAPEFNFADLYTPTLDEAAAAQGEEQDSTADPATQSTQPEPEPKPEPEPAKTDTKKPEQDSEEPELRMRPTEELFEDQPAEPESPEGDARYEQLYNYYKDQGLITVEFERPPRNAEEYAQVLNQQRTLEQQQIAEQILGSTPEFARSMIEYAMTRGEELTPEELQNFIEVAETRAQIDPDAIQDKEQAREYLQDYYVRKGEKSNRIKDFLDVLEDKDELLPAAREAAEQELELMNQWEEEQKEYARAAAEQERQKVEQLHNNVVSYLEELPWKQQHKERVYQEIFTEQLAQKTAGIMDHPMALIQLANYMSFFDPERGYVDENTWRKQTFSGESKNLKKKIDEAFSLSGAQVTNREEARSEKPKKDNTVYTFAE